MPSETVQVYLAIIGLAGAAITGLIWAMKAQGKASIAQAGADRVTRADLVTMVTNHMAHQAATLETVASYLGEQTKFNAVQTEVLREIREELRDARRAKAG